MNIAVAPPPPINLSADFHKAAKSGSATDIANYLLIEKTELAPADLILVFGNPYIAQKSALLAAKLYHQGYAPIIVATGGIETIDGDIEAIEIYKELRNQGVKEFDIIVDEYSTNTQENVLNSKALFSQICSYTPPSSLIGIGHAVAGRRFLMTLAQNWPEITLPMASNVWPDGMNSQNWHEQPAMFEEVRAQLDRIAPYTANGFIKEIDLIRINEQARARMAEHVFCPV